MKYKVGKSKIEGDGLFANKALKENELIGLAHLNDEPTEIVGKYHNHSDNPNAYSVKVKNKRFIYALRDLKPGEEITVDYRKQPELEQPEMFKRGGQKKYTRDITAINFLNAEHFLSKKPKRNKKRIYSPTAKYYAEGGEPGKPDPRTQFYTVQGSDGVYRKVNGKWEVDWNRSGKFQPLSKGDIAKRTAILNSQAKPLYDPVYDDLYITTQSSYSALPKPSVNKKLTQEDKAAQKVFDESFDVKTGPKEMKVEDYQYPANTYAATSWESQKEQLPQAYDDVNNFYSNWYMGRATLPEFRNVALQRYNALNPQVTVQAQETFSKDHPTSLLAATYRKTTSAENKDKANQIFIGNAMYPDTDFGENHYYNKELGNPQNALQYFTNEYAHEKSHWYENNFPQEGTNPDYYDNELPSKSQLYAKGRPTIDYFNIDTSPEASTWTNDRFKGVPAEQYPYLAKPTEVRARLNVWRMQNNIDPTKKYTVDEIRKIMDDNIKNFGTSHDNIRELYKLINNNPEALKQLNDRYVSNDSNQELNIAEKGGTPGKPDPKTQFYTVKGSDGVYRKVNGKWEVDWNRSGKFQPLSKGDVAKRTAVLNSQAKPLYDPVYDDLYATQRQQFTPKPVNKPTPAKSTGKIKSFDNSLYTADETMEGKPVNYVDKNDPSKHYVLWGKVIFQPGRPGGSLIKDENEIANIRKNIRVATQFDLDRLPANQIYSSDDELEYIRRAASGEDPYVVNAELKNREAANKDQAFFNNNFQLKEVDPNKWDPMRLDLAKENSDKSIDFLQQWQQSPMYYEMLRNSAGDDFEYHKKGRDLRFLDGNLNPSFVNRNDPTAIGRSFGDGIIEFYPQTSFTDLDVIPHEYSHATDDNGRYIPKKDIELLKSYATDPKQTRLYTQGYADDSDLNQQYEYLTDPTETRARLNALRFAAKESGVYDPFTKKVNPDIFKRFENIDTWFNDDGRHENSPLKDLKKVYTDEQIIEMLNTISKNNESNQEFNFAQKGGQQGDRFKKRLMKRYPGMTGVYGDEGENLSIVKDPNYDARSVGYGDIEFQFPEGNPEIRYDNLIEKNGPEYIYPNPSPDKYTALYNPRGANRGDVFLDMMHGMRDDPNYQPLLQNFEKAVRDARGGDMAWYYDKQVKDGYTGGQEQWDANYLDGQLRAQLAPGTIGMFSHGRRDYRKERRHDSPEMRAAAEDIRNYLKGEYQDGGLVEVRGYEGNKFRKNANGKWEYESGRPVEDQLLIQKLTYESKPVGSPVVQGAPKPPKLKPIANSNISKPIQKIYPSRNPSETLQQVANMSVPQSQEQRANLEEARKLTAQRKFNLESFLVQQGYNEKEAASIVASYGDNWPDLEEKYAREIATMQNRVAAREQGETPDKMSTYTPRPTQAWNDKLQDIVFNPFTSAGYLIRGQEIPDYMGEQIDNGTLGYWSNGRFIQGRNALDTAIDVATPIGWAHSADNIINRATNDESGDFWTEETVWDALNIAPGLKFLKGAKGLKAANTATGLARYTDNMFDLAQRARLTASKPLVVNAAIDAGSIMREPFYAPQRPSLFSPTISPLQKTLLPNTSLNVNRVMSDASKFTKLNNMLSAPTGTIHLAQQVLGEVLQGNRNRKAIAAGNDWLENWISHPVTQDKVNLSLDIAKKNRIASDDEIDLLREQSLKFKPISAEYPLSNQLKDNLQQYKGYSNKENIHSGNFGVSYTHKTNPFNRDLYSYKKPWPEYGSWISRSPLISDAKRRSTTIHEGTHDWTSRRALDVTAQRISILNSMNPDIKKDFLEWEDLRSQGKSDSEIEKIMGVKRSDNGYYANPTEIHARIMQLRDYFNLTPDMYIGSRTASDMIKKLESLPSYKQPINVKMFLKVIDKDPDNLSYLFNRLWAVPPALMIGTSMLEDEKTNN